MRASVDRRARRGACLAAAIAIAIAAVLALAGRPADAGATVVHGVLRRAEPTADARLDEVPREVRLTFNEPVELAVASLALRDASGAAVALSPPRRGDSASVIVADVVGRLAAGTYTVAWQIAGRDGHPVRGEHAFIVLPGAAGLAADPRASPATRSPPSVAASSAPAAAPGAFDASSPLYAAVRWLGFAGLLGVVGAAAYGAVVAPRADAVSGPTVARVGLAAAAVLLVAAALRLVAQAVALHGPDAFDPARVGASLGATLGATRWGAGWLLQVGGGAVAAAGFAVRARGRGAGGALAVVGAVGAAAASALVGHAAALPDRAVLAMTADALHVLGAGVWVGGLALLALVGLPRAARAAAPDRARRTADLLHAFAPLAIAGATTVALTGGVAAWLHVGSVESLVATRYGRVLLAKLALVALVALLGARNWRAGRAAVTHADGVRRAAAIELALGALVLAATAVLVATPTPADAG